MGTRAWGRRANDLRRNERGQGMVEYSLILVLVAVACAGAVTTVGQQILSLVMDSAGQIFG